MLATMKRDGVDSAVKHEIEENGHTEEPFFICDISSVQKQFDNWRMLLPRVWILYAIKCNTDKELLNTVAKLGTGFDCASKTEIATMLDMGVDPSRIIYANPCKPASHIRFARERGVRLMTFDNVEELAKTKRNFPEADLILRIITDDSKSAYGFSSKFGAALPSIEPLLQAARSMELNVVGVSFHVGSLCVDSSNYRTAIHWSRFAFDKARELGFEFNILDIGGGFPGIEKNITMKEIAKVVSESIDAYFPYSDFPNLRLIAEPGRYLCTTAFTLAVPIISKREMAAKDSSSNNKFLYYLNDGIYGSLYYIFDHYVNFCPSDIVVRKHGRFLNHETMFGKEPLYGSSLWGPTSDTMDCIVINVKLPELDVGDWLVFKNFGAYTNVLATTFNGFPRTKLVYINQQFDGLEMSLTKTEGEECSRNNGYEHFQDIKMPAKVHSAVEHVIENGDGEKPFFICDLGAVAEQFNKWKALLPHVEPFYAVKCNTDKTMLNVLKNLGTGFDCGSQAEIATMLSIGIDPSRIIYANPCKPVSHIRFACEKGVHLMTFDNTAELAKIKYEFPEAQLLLHIAVDNSTSASQFSVKFGTAMTSVKSLLEAAMAMELNIIGVSFHVESGCKDVAQYDAALKMARFAFDKAREIGFGDHFHLLDIGGGFPGLETDATLEQIATVVNNALNVYFPKSYFPRLRVIAEPGRYFATTAFTLAVSITSLREVPGNDSHSKQFMYYINDGIYGSFNHILMYYFNGGIYGPYNRICDYVKSLRPEVIMQHGRFLSRQCHQDSSETDEKKTTNFVCTLFGPTCDSTDYILKQVELPQLYIGDWLIFKNMGAYTGATATTFNGFPQTEVFHINHLPLDYAKYSKQDSDSKT